MKRLARLLSTSALPAVVLMIEGGGSRLGPREAGAFARSLTRAAPADSPSEASFETDVLTFKQFPPKAPEPQAPRPPWRSMQ